MFSPGCVAGFTIERSGAFSEPLALAPRLRWYGLLPPATKRPRFPENTLRTHLHQALLVALLSLGAAPAAQGALISELLYDAEGSDNGFSFVEISAAPGADLTGWTLAVVNGADGAVAATIALGGTVPDDRVYVVADQDAGGGTSVPNADHLENFDIQNGPDSLQLFDAGGTLLDAVGFGVFGAGDVFAGEGTPAPDAPAGTSLERLFGDLDTGDNAADFAIQTTPTPGFVLFQHDPPPGPGPGAPIPEPSAALLCGLGLIWLGGRRKR